MITYCIGDATKPQFPTSTYPIIVHAVNDEGLWGKGFTGALTRRFGTLVQQKYRRWWFAENAKLGDVYIDPQGGVAIAHLMAQRGVGRGQRRVDYLALETALCLLPAACRVLVGPLNFSFHMPRIGCGLGGGAWSTVEPLVARALGAYAVTVYDLEGACHVS